MGVCEYLMSITNRTCQFEQCFFRHIGQFRHLDFQDVKLHVHEVVKPKWHKIGHPIVYDSTQVSGSQNQI